MQGIFVGSLPRMCQPWPGVGPAPYGRQLRVPRRPHPRLQVLLPFGGEAGAPAAAPEPKECTYTVKSGDSLFTIAKVTTTEQGWGGNERRTSGVPCLPCLVRPTSIHRPYLPPLPPLCARRLRAPPWTPWWP